MRTERFRCGGELSGLGWEWPRLLTHSGCFDRLTPTLIPFPSSFLRLQITHSLTRIMRLQLSCLALLTSFAAAASAHDRRDAVTDSLQAGLSALARPALSDPRSTVNAVIEQYIGILPPVSLIAVQQGGRASFSSLRRTLTSLQQP